MTQAADPQIIVSVFLRKGREGQQTKLFENLSTDAKNAVLSKAALGPDEEPVIACFDRTNGWFLVTTERLIWTSSGGLNALSILQVDYVEDNFEAAYRRWLAADDRENRNPKMEIDELELVAVDGCRAAVTLEPGYPFHGLSNALMWLCTWARSQCNKAGAK
jgi:hypothetical protein